MGMNGKKKKAVVLLSGGVDSTTVLAMVRAQGYAIHALTVDYGQRHSIEVGRARKIARTYAVASHRVLRLDLTGIGGSALTDHIPVPKKKGQSPPGTVPRIPATYVPARNTIFLSLALALAERVRARDIFIGANAVDYSGYPDCRPPFLRAFERLSRLATKAGVQGRMTFRIHAPLLRMTKAEIISRGLSLGVDYGLTHSCYDPGPGGRPCGRCDSCRLRLKGFREAGAADPLTYAAPVS